MAQQFKPTVIEKVDPDLEGRAATVETPGREPADVDVQRRVPPVVAGRRGGEPDLADDLHAQVQRVLGRAPVGQVQLGKRHAASTTNPTSST